MGDSVEREFAQSIIDVVHVKHCKLHSHYERYGSDRLLIYHNQPSPIIDIDKARVYTANILLITYEAQLPAAGPRWQGFRRQRDDLSGWIDRRFALSNDPPTLIGSRVRARAEDCT